MSRKKRQQIRHDALARVQRFLTERPGEDLRMRRLRKQCQKYELKLRQGEVRARADHDYKAQVKAYVRAAERQAQREISVRELVYQAGVPQCLVFQYLCYARHVQKLKREFTGLTLGTHIDIAIDRWAMRGLDPEVLRRIADSVIGG